MDLQEALAQVDHIQKQLAHSATFRGYRSAPAACSAVAAFLTAVWQGICLPAPASDPSAFVRLWVGVAILCGLIQGAELALQAWQDGRRSTTRLTFRALELLFPCIVAGGMVTLVLALFAPEAVWLLPGLWGIFLGLGVFASLPLLPRAVSIVGFHYLFCGVACLVFARGAWACTPWSMALTFGGGQALSALVLYFTLERRHG